MDRNEILKVVCANMKEIIDNARDAEIDESKSMKDYGADSLEMVEVVSRSMKQLKIKVPRTELTKAQNIAELVNLFVEHQSV